MLCYIGLPRRHSFSTKTPLKKNHIDRPPEPETTTNAADRGIEMASKTVVGAEGGNIAMGKKKPSMDI